MFSETIPAAETPQQARMRRMTGGDNDSPSRELARYLFEIAQKYVPNLDVVLIYRPDRFLRGGDHLPFQQKGYTAVRLTEYYENFTHQHQDIRQETVSCTAIFRSSWILLICEKHGTQLSRTGESGFRTGRPATCVAQRR